MSVMEILSWVFTLLALIGLGAGVTGGTSAYYDRQRLDKRKRKR